MRLLRAVALILALAAVLAAVVLVMTRGSWGSGGPS